MIESAQDLFGVLVISMTITLKDSNGNSREKLIAVARIHCQRKNAEKEFLSFRDFNSSKLFRAEFHFNSALIH